MEHNYKKYVYKVGSNNTEELQYNLCTESSYIKSQYPAIHFLYLLSHTGWHGIQFFCEFILLSILYLKIMNQFHKAIQILFI